MNISVDFSSLRDAKWYQFALRFFFGGAICVLAGLIAEKYGPTVGGLFLAFPAIFPASATLLENEQKERKKKVGLHGAIRGRKVAGVDAVGSSMGTIALMVFAAIVWKLLPDHPAGLILLGATIIWFAASVAIWRTRSLLLHWFNRRKTQREPYRVP
ncbi:MAG: DUF3147 family protein [Candidatus Acidiferrales bacterium]